MDNAVYALLVVIVLVVEQIVYTVEQTVCSDTTLAALGVPQEYRACAKEINQEVAIYQFHENIAGALPACLAGSLLPGWGPDSPMCTTIISQVASHTRRRRATIDFTLFPEFQWDVTLPLKYKIDTTAGDLTDVNVVAIDTAVNMWQEATCIDFEKVPFSETVDGPHILFKAGTGCISFSGMSPGNNSPQPIFLKGDDDCSNYAGSVSLLIANTLGFFHEHMRADRDDYVEVLEENVQPDELVFFANFGVNLDTFDHPYDMGSVTHFPPWKYQVSADVSTIIPKDILYWKTIGQRVRPSFWDIKKVNEAYCPDVCASSTVQCPPPNYRNPRNCDHCVCYDGLGGALCETPSHPVGDVCGGEVDVTGSGVLSFPNVPSGSYSTGQRCSWRLTAPVGHQLRVFFDSEHDFGIYERDGVCFHWLEVKLAQNKSITGYRFCGTEAPRHPDTGVIISLTTEPEVNEVLVIFQADYSAPEDVVLAGFQLLYEAVGGNACEPNPCQNGGTCQVVAGDAECSCHDMFTGPLCQYATCGGCLREPGTCNGDQMMSNVDVACKLPLSADIGHDCTGSAYHWLWWKPHPDSSVNVEEYCCSRAALLHPCSKATRCVVNGWTEWTACVRKRKRNCGGCWRRERYYYEDGHRVLGGMSYEDMYSHQGCGSNFWKCRGSDRCCDGLVYHPNGRRCKPEP